MKPATKERGGNVKGAFSAEGITQRIRRMMTAKDHQPPTQVLEAGNAVRPESQAARNVILRGSSLIGDITVTQDLEISGTVEGNVVSDRKCDIVIRGTCRGNITSKEGNVEVEGEMRGGDILAGGSVSISGKFLGGRVEAGDRIFLNGEFSGTLLANDIELGPDTHGQGELYFRDYISIQKGADVEVQIHRIKNSREVTGEPPSAHVIDLDLSLRRKGEAS